MSHLSIYLDNETEVTVRKAAENSSMSVSKWIVYQLKKSVQTEWSEHFKQLAGSLPDLPDLDDIREGFSTDSSREKW